MGNVVKISHKIIRCISLFIFHNYIISRANSILTKHFQKLWSCKGFVWCFF